MKSLNPTIQKIAGTHAERLAIDGATLQPHCFFAETDSGDNYEWVDNGWFKTGANRMNLSVQVVWDPNTLSYVIATGGSTPGQNVAVTNFPTSQAVTGPLTDAQLRAQNVNVAFDDIAQLDAFSRLRVSNPEHVFDAQMTYDLQPLLYEQITANGGTVTYDSTNRCALMTFAGATTGCKAFMQSFQYFQYQPGRSQLIFVTFNMVEAKANVLKFAGYSDGSNGVEFQLNGSTPQMTLYSTSSNGNQTVTQSNWNIDKLDGTGASGITLDVTKVQILVISLQALYVGRVVVGFDIDGKIVPVHAFKHANKINSPYIANANLPIRCGMTGTATVSTTMNFICCNVTSEGGNADRLGFHFTQNGSVTAANGARTHLLSIQKKPTFNGLVNRGVVELESLNIVVTGNNPVYWELVIGQAITGTTTFNDVNTTYSGIQYNNAGTLSGSETIEFAAGFVAASNQAKGVDNLGVNLRYPMSLDAAGAIRLNGRISLVVTGIGGTSACQATISWREIR